MSNPGRSHRCEHCDGYFSDKRKRNINENSCITKVCKEIPHVRDEEVTNCTRDIPAPGVEYMEVINVLAVQTAKYRRENSAATRAAAHQMTKPYCSADQKDKNREESSSTEPQTKEVTGKLGGWRESGIRLTDNTSKNRDR